MLKVTFFVIISRSQEHLNYISKGKSGVSSASGVANTNGSIWDWVKDGWNVLNSYFPPLINDSNIYRKLLKSATEG